MGVGDALLEALARDGGWLVDAMRADVLGMPQLTTGRDRSARRAAQAGHKRSAGEAQRRRTTCG
jgi:hypothetical protein